jgi:N utilization substance protein B
MQKETIPQIRRKARVLALQSLYEVDVVGHPVTRSLGWFNEEEKLPEESSAYALELMEGVVKQCDDIDNHIRRFAPAWPVKQLSVIDRNILRLALFEIHYSHDIPRKVVINEAVELAKIFGSESSPRFVNGVLGSVVDELKITPLDSEGARPASSNNIEQKGK